MKNKDGKPAKIHTSEVLNECFSVSDKNKVQKIEKSMFLAIRIDEAIKKAGFKKGQFAAAMNIQPSVVSKWLSGTHNFTIDTLFDIERVLNIKIIKTEEDKPIQSFLWVPPDNYLIKH